MEKYKEDFFYTVEGVEPRPKACSPIEILKPTWIINRKLNKELWLCFNSLPMYIREVSMVGDSCTFPPSGCPADDGSYAHKDNKEKDRINPKIVYGFGAYLLYYLDNRENELHFTQAGIDRDYIYQAYLDRHFKIYKEDKQRLVKYSGEKGKTMLYDEFLNQHFKEEKSLVSKCNPLLFEYPFMDKKFFTDIVKGYNDFLGSLIKKEEISISYSEDDILKHFMPIFHKGIISEGKTRWELVRSEIEKDILKTAEHKAALASWLYRCKWFKDHKTIKFKDWLQQFYSYVGSDKTTDYKPSKLRGLGKLLGSLQLDFNLLEGAREK